VIGGGIKGFRQDLRNPFNPSGADCSATGLSRDNELEAKMNFRELEKIIKQDGWKLARTNGSHHIYQHPSKPGIVILPNHPGDIPKATEISILKQAGLK
jgi:predicted RNA binding protein YcfA (HicA-like mRNA interferase family)